MVARLQSCKANHSATLQLCNSELFRPANLLEVEGQWLGRYLVDAGELIAVRDDAVKGHDVDKDALFEHDRFGLCKKCRDVLLGMARA